MKARAWLRLHRVVYLVAIMGVAHYYLLVKADHRDPVFYAVVVAALLAIRLAPRSGRGAG